MATNNSVDTSLSGQTGTVNFVGSISPTLITPTLGVATATSIVFSPSSSGMIGTTTNNNATTGTVGEFVSSFIPEASGITLTTSVDANVTSISLTAGDWDVWGNVEFNATGAGTAYNGWVSSTSATFPDSSLRFHKSSPAGSMSWDVPQQRFNISSTTTIYLSARGVFGAITVKASGGIYAVRRR